MTTRNKSSGEKSNFIAQRKEGMVVPEEGQSEEEKSAWVQLVPALSVQVARGVYQTVEEGEVVNEEQSQHDKHNKEDPSKAACPKGVGKTTDTSFSTILDSSFTSIELHGFNLSYASR
jgi:hypothetical protein